MPTIFEKDGYRVMIYTNDHEPPHVHVAHHDVVMAISIEGGVARFRQGSEKNRSPHERQIRRAEEIVSERLEDCMAAWTRYHGKAIMKHRNGVAAPAATERSVGPRARSVAYDARKDEVRLVLAGGVTVVIPRKLIDDLRDAPAAHMQELTLLDDGGVLVSQADDAHVLVPGLLWNLIRFDVPVSCWPGYPSPSDHRAVT